MAPALLAHLRTATASALSDPALVAEGERTRRYVAYVDGQDTSARVASVLGELTPAQREMLKTIVAKGQ